MKLNTLSMLCLCAAASIAVYLTLGTRPTVSKKADTLIVGMAAGYAPFVSINPAGEYEGFDIDVARALAEKMGKKLVLKDLGSMTSLFTALDQESIDVIIWGLSITQARLAKVSMIHYQGTPTTSYPLVFWEKIPENVSSLADMNGTTVCVEPGSSQEAVLNRYPLATPLPTEKVDDALLNIQYGKADAALLEPAIAQKFKNKYPQLQILEIPLTPEDRVQGVGIVVKKNNLSSITQIEKAVEELKADGTIAKLEKQWGIIS